MKSQEQIVEEILAMLQKPVFFYDILNKLENDSYRKILIAWGNIREKYELARDEIGRYILKA